MKSLTVIDIDDTLFKTECRIYVTKEGTRILTLDTHTYANYKLKPDEKFDFSEFRSSEAFANTAVRVDGAFKTIKKMMEGLRHDHKKFVLLTARGSPDNIERIQETFRKFGFDIDRTEIYFSGDLQEKLHIPAYEVKKVIIRKLLREDDYKIVRMIDDSRRNIQCFMELRNEFHSIRFEAFLVAPSGTLIRV